MGSTTERRPLIINLDRSEMKTRFPNSCEEVLTVIKDAERHRKFVWTVGRVLRETALWTRLESLPYKERKIVLKRLASFLEDLAQQGVLQRRGDVQSIGYGDEIGFDYVAPERLKLTQTEKLESPVESS
jgi:hypothetical protein